MNSFSLLSHNSRTPSTMLKQPVRQACAAVLSLFLTLGVFTHAPVAQAALFGDDEARKAILDLRQQVANQSQQQAASAQQLADELSQLRRSLLDLQSQIENLRAEQAQLRGQNEQLMRDLADVQRHQKDLVQSTDERLRQFEPSKVEVDGRSFNAEPSERKDFETALAAFRKGNFTGAQQGFGDFLKRYPQSGYAPSAMFWLGNAQYATRDYKEAIATFKAMLSVAPEHARAPEVALALANCQIEMKDTKAARKTLEDLQKVYPNTEAATAARERLSQLK